MVSYKTRAQIRADIIGQMTRFYGYPKCYLCDEPGSDVHEIISRNRTQYNDGIRQKTFAPELCAWLCDACHQNKAVRKSVQTELLGINAALYSWKRVKTAFDEIPAKFTRGIHFPSLEEYLKETYGHFDNIKNNVTETMDDLNDIVDGHIKRDTNA